MPGFEHLIQQFAQGGGEPGMGATGAPPMPGPMPGGPPVPFGGGGPDMGGGMPMEGGGDEQGMMLLLLLLSLLQQQQGGGMDMGAGPMGGGARPPMSPGIPGGY